MKKTIASIIFTLTLASTVSAQVQDPYQRGSSFDYSGSRYSNNFQQPAYPNQVQPSHHNSGWFQSVSEILRYKRQQALGQYHRGNHSSALQTFKVGVQQAFNQAAFSYHGSASFRWIKRTMDMFHFLDRSLPLDNKSVRVLGLFLDESYKFLINHSLRFDDQYYNYNYGYDSVAEQERQFINTAFDYMEKMTDSFITKDRYGNVYPFGSLPLTKKVFELVAGYGNLDLDESFQSEYYSCERRELFTISQNLRAVPYQAINVHTLTQAYDDLDDALNGYTCN